MNEDRTFEREARAWLELGPSTAPKQVVDAALLAIDSTGQQRNLRLPWRGFRMSTQMRLATAAAIGILVVGGGWWLLRGPQTNLAGPGPTATATASPGASPAGPTPSPATSAEFNGWIAVKFGGLPEAWTIDTGGGQIWLVRADGSGLHELAPGKPAGGKGPFDISPDGTKIAFEGSGRGIWEVSLTGGDPVLVSTGCEPVGTDTTGICLDGTPAYSPDGTKLAFGRAGGGTYRIGVRDLATGAVDMLESTGVPSPDLQRRAAWPTWSPDGRQIAFQRFTRNWLNLGTDLPTHYAQIEVVNVDGTGLRELTPATGLGNTGRPEWSPDGSTILFSTVVDVWGNDDFSVIGDIYTIRPDGTGLTKLCLQSPCLSQNGARPTWTPDGKHVLFVSAGRLALMHPDGGNQAVVNEPRLAFVEHQLTGLMMVMLQPAP